MGFLTDLWLPILLSAVFVFLASSVLHMLIPVHAGDLEKLPDEEAVLASLREHGVTPGDYMFPFPASMKAMGEPETIERFKLGPVGWLTVLPNGVPNMGRSLGQWFVYCLVISVFVAYVASFAQQAGGDYLDTFRLTGTLATLVYASGNVTNSIWRGCRWLTTWKFVFDGVVYGLVTAGTFAWLRPGA